MGTADGSSWAKQLVAGLGALLAVALIIGAIVGVVALALARFAGVGDPSNRPGAGQSLYIPGLPSTATSHPTRQSPTSAPTRTTSHPPSPTATKSKKPRKAITLQGFPQKVSPGQRINLTGVYRGGEGTTLQVQRFQGGWKDFPVTASVSGGQFHTFVVTSQGGPTRFRVLDSSSGRHSNAVRIVVG